MVIVSPGTTRCSSAAVGIRLVASMPRRRPARSGPTESGRPAPLREAQKALTRERLVDAAIATFREHGFGSATIDEVARRANFSRTTFYLHFDSKSDVASAIGDRIGEAAFDQILQLAELPRLDAEHIRGWLDERIGLLGEHPVWIEVVVTANVSEPGLLHEGMEIDLDITDQLLVRFAERGWQPTPTAKAEIFTCLFGLERILLPPTAHGIALPPGTLDAVARQFEATLARVLVPATANADRRRRSARGPADQPAASVAR